MRGKPKRHGARLSDLTQMKRIHEADWFWFEGQGWKVNARGSGLFVHILRALLGVFNEALNKQRRVFVFRFDVRLKCFSETNRVASSIVSQLRKRAELLYPGSAFRYCWVREQGVFDPQHYHFVLFMDGRYIQHPHRLQREIQVISALLEGVPHWSGYHRIDRLSDRYLETLQQASYHISYLAKVRTKGKRLDTVRDYSISRLKGGS